MENRPWWPKVTTYPNLILDDHATEWASRITDDETRIEVDGGEPESMSEAARARAITRNDFSYGEQWRSYAAERVWSGDLSSDLC